MEPIRKAMTPAEQEAALAELFDGTNESIFVTCGKHGYYPGKGGIENVAVVPPVNVDCKHCWEAFLLVYFAKLPPHIREQRLEEFEIAAHHAAEAEDKGRADWKLYRHPKIEMGS